VKPSKHMLGDKAYDSAELREELHERGTNCRRVPPRSLKRLISMDMGAKGVPISLL
jgi:hypothetical protein